ncbi:MAG: hypothetical protein WCG10_07440 [Chlamydiota bacterium]
MQLIKQLFLFLMFSSVLYSTEHYELFVDPYYSPYMGSALFLTGHKSLEKIEDQWIFPSTPPKRGVLASVGRIVELTLFWNPINSLICVVQHEVFGHGYRARSLHDVAKVKSYSIGKPSPYGHGGGATFMSYKETIKIGQIQSVAIGGLESESILAREQKIKWLSSGYINPKSASLYDMAALSSFIYTFAQKDDKFFSGNDLETYVNLLNILYPNDQISRHKLRSALKYNFIDPMLYYDIAASWYYIFTGKSLSIPMISLGSVSCLPNVHVDLAPYGIEYYLENYFLYEKSPFYTYIKAGKHGGNKYYGCGVHYDELIQSDKMSMGFRFDGWYQPNFLADWELEQLFEGYRYRFVTTQLATSKLGAAASIVSRICINNTLSFFYSDIGYKTEGYLPGFPLQKSMTLRLGFSASF